MDGNLDIFENVTTEKPWTERKAMDGNLEIFENVTVSKRLRTPALYGGTKINN